MRTLIIPVSEHTPDECQKTEAEARRLVGQVEQLVAEWNTGHVTLAGFLGKLRQLSDEGSPLLLGHVSDWFEGVAA